jgi:uncharacterized protein
MAGDLFDVEGTPDQDGASIVLRLYVQPGAGRAAVVGHRGDALHVRVAPPPVDGRANEACVELVAELLGVPRSRVELAGGERARLKRVRVTGVDPAEVEHLLEEAVAEGAAGPSGRERGGRRRR